MKSTSKKMGFTLIELLVVIAIIAILAAILFPVLSQARIAAKKASTVSAMKQQALSIIMYSDDQDSMAPPRYSYNATAPLGQRSYAWEQLVQPYTKNYAIFMSPEDGRPRYNTPFAGQYRRSFAMAGNIAIAIQKPGLTTKPSRTISSIAQPADSVLAGMKFMLHRPQFANAYWEIEQWNFEAVIYNTRNAQLPLTDPRAAFGEIQNVYSGGSVFAYADGHVAVKKANGFSQTNQTGGSTTVPHGTKLDGYEERAGSWVGSPDSFWDRGISCLEAEVSPTSTNRDCILPGE